ncbi:cupin domain-containing protein [Paroceanicella profunda]|uniref:Cupin domain-containing protein n=1 Tax=Paroceanicella profunda TaxID=2579971 RepID=A0A5B8FGC3_9RHOB|nr:cupin domain-containing protein [Paroceanicella profunda]QDL90688.1 cupin domain-containing protein [Paroceanicella profunda]
MQDAQDIIRTLGLQPHPEGGWYRETWRATAPEGVRPGGTAIHFLLEAHQRSHWHRVDATEIWLWHAGHPLTLGIDDRDHRLGPDLAAGEAPQLIVPAGAWQAATPLGGWVLVSCIVCPGFDFAGFDLAPPGWVPPGRTPA